MIKITFYRPKIFTRKYWRERKQLRQQGFLDEETFGLYHPLAKFILPRLRCFRECAFDEHKNGRTGARRSDWCKIVDRMIWSMNEIVEHDGCPPDEVPRGTEEEEDRKRRRYFAKLQEGLTLFGRHFMGLWW